MSARVQLAWFSTASERVPNGWRTRDLVHPLSLEIHDWLVDNGLDATVSHVRVCVYPTVWSNLIDQLSRRAAWRE